MKLEIIIPLRNPAPEMLRATVASMCAQTHLGYSVIVSDNHSTDGHPRDIEHVVSSLCESGLDTHLIKPPKPLGRVDHWNWALLCGSRHRGWLKPLFAGDTLERDAVQKITSLAEGTSVQGLFSNYYHRDLHGRVFIRSVTAYCGLLCRIMRIRLAPPCCSAFTWNAFAGSHAYPPQFPGFADSFLCNVMTRTFKVAFPNEPLATFAENVNRYSRRSRTKSMWEYLKFLKAVNTVRINGTDPTLEVGRRRWIAEMEGLSGTIPSVAGLTG